MAVEPVTADPFTMLVEAVVSAVEKHRPAICQFLQMIPFAVAGADTELDYYQPVKPPAEMTLSELGSLVSVPIAAALASDQLDPSRLCGWCFHPRNSPECQFAAKHVPYREMFA